MRVCYWVCAYVWFETAAEKKGRRGGGCILLSWWQRWWKKGVCPRTPLAQWVHSSVSDITTPCLTYLKWPWRHSCLFQSVSFFIHCPLYPVCYTTPFSQPLTILAPSFTSFWSLFITFSQPFCNYAEANTREKTSSAKWDTEERWE